MLLVLNKEQKQTGEVTPNMGTDLKTKSKQNYNPHEATNAKHTEPTQANVINGMTKKNDNTQLANDTLNMDLGNKQKRKRKWDLPNVNPAQETDMQDTTNNKRKTNNININAHTQKKTNRKGSETQTRTTCVSVARRIEKKRTQKEIRNREKETNVRKRETMCETAHRKAKKIPNETRTSVIRKKK